MIKQKDTAEARIVADTAARRDTTNTNVQKWTRTGHGGRILQCHPTPPDGKIETTPSTGGSGIKIARKSMKRRRDENPL